ncbi:dihydroxyacetone kinase subunit L [uncultured Nitratireductor sp.]|uniref:dihydroxyacetone kinase subunit L n=1 Tax=uncultured Nitratireductor sp. TaxID=520953 RepID=UPI0025CCA077|nr:dihydroxyacetone kinase subunit L [uncultured Nitratireductor sp.]
MIDSSAIAKALSGIAAHTATASEELCSADGALGDGDLGITVSKGFAEAAGAELPNDVGIALLTVAKAFQRVSSSSYGTLLATGFMAAAKLEKGKTGIAPEDIPGLVAAARDAMMARGKGNLGDKSVLDSLDAVAEALRDTPRGDMIDTAITAAAESIERFRDQPSKLGRARMFGEKSVGLADPGQLAFLRILEGLNGT